MSEDVHHRTLRDRLNNFFVRFKLDASDDSGPLQKVRGRGRAQEFYGSAQRMVIRLQQAGLSARPSAGAEGLAINMGGNNDLTMIISLELPSKRPTGLNEGETQLYDEFGDFIRLDRDQVISISAKTIKLIATEKIILEAPELYLGGDPDEGGTFQKVAHALTQDSDGDVLNGATCSPHVWTKAS